MADETKGGGFTSMADAKATYMMYPPAAVPRMVGIAGRNGDAVAEAANRYGYEKWYTDWRDMLENDEIDVFDNGGPNDAHAEPTIAAAKAGKHVFCEKPLGRTAEEAKSMLDAGGLQLPLCPRGDARQKVDRERRTGQDLSLALGLSARLGHGSRNAD